MGVQSGAGLARMGEGRQVLEVFQSPAVGVVVCYGLSLFLEVYVLEAWLLCDSVEVVEGT